jgi:hypothetical protein
MSTKSTYAVRPEEKVLIESMLEFANLRAIISTTQVEEIFKKNVHLIGNIFGAIEPANRIAYEDDQRELQGWLAKIAKSVRGQRAVMPEVAHRLRTGHTHVTFHENAIHAPVALVGVQACYSYAVALILDKRHKSTSRLSQCGWSGCGIFHFDFSPAGRPREYCDSRHKWRAEAEAKRKLDRV